MGDTNLSQTISATNDSGSAYDTNVKFLLADKQILSWILKYTLIEFADMEVSGIRGCIKLGYRLENRIVFYLARMIWVFHLYLNGIPLFFAQNREGEERYENCCACGKAEPVPPRILQ